MDMAPVVDNTSGAAITDVLSRKTFWGLRSGAWGPVTGNVAAGANVTGTAGSQVITIPAGLYSGSTTATANDAYLLDTNIKNYALAAIFATLFAAVFGFAWWDRRSILITARAEVEASTQDIRGAALRSERLIEVLRSFAENVPNLKVLMRQANLL
jgi:hypothetical protein